MPPKKHIIIIGVLCVIALGLGYWYGLPEEETTPEEPEFLKQGLVAYYPFNGNAKDESGTGNDGNVNGTTLTKDRHGKADNAYSFDGKDDLIEIPSSQSINAMQDFSISFWVKANKNQPGISADAVGLITRWDQSKVRDAFGVWIKGGEWAGVCVWPRGGTWDMTGYFQK